MGKKLLFKDALKASYKTKEEAEQTYKKHGYNFDKDLSNIHSRVYYQPDDKHLLVSYRGTHNLYNDIPTDLAILTGNLKNTDRYKHSKEVLDNAKKKYNTSATIIGHSAGGSLASAVNSDDRDKIITFNKGAGLLTKPHEAKHNENSYRINGDIVSSLSKYDHNQKTLKNNTLHNPHFLDNLDNHSIYVFKKIKYLIKFIYNEFPKRFKLKQ
jgi:hypothetical protein